MNWLKTLTDNLFSPRREREKEYDQIALSAVEIKKRMAGIHIFTVATDSENDRCSVLSYCEKRKMEFFFFSKSEAEAFAQAYNQDYKGCGTSLGIIHTLRLPLTEVVDYKRIGSSFRLVPELSQVKNATQEILTKNVAASPHDVIFSGVPVFQADCLSFDRPFEQGKTYQPLFLRKEDLERTLARYEVPGSKTNRIDIQVFSLEEVIHAMKDCSTSKWNDAVIVAPGLTLWASNHWHQQFV